ncbi:tbc1 domain family member 15 [Phtheirospermum japonicum]|uniref:Tbc1 domain family member 15 n=1 Tax=Phtheirospermum japonicum TaxID=374723 RepID=A0A830B795_9LAMI|nr:tbc1 domain family member 15 [Phtheirospermum japonicum]
MFFNSAAEELDSYYPVRSECLADVPKTRFKARVGKTLGSRRWNAAFTEDGHLDIAGVLRRIQRGGIHPTIKGAVWEFLLGCYDPNSTYDERNEVREQRRSQYAAWKDLCQKMVPAVGSGKFITTPIITDDGHPVQDPSNVYNGLDVVRTDRTLVYYEDEANQAKLWDVLAVYAWVDKDIGYVQGMNDICSPMVILFEHEADAFWCFERAMRRLVMWAMEYNPDIYSAYEESRELGSSSSELKASQLKQYGKFERKNLKSGWTDQRGALAVFLVASVLEKKNKRLLKEAQGLDDVVQILGEITGNLDAKKALKEALKIHKNNMINLVDEFVEVVMIM